MTLHVDQEHALGYLRDKVRDKTGRDKVTIRKSPRYSSQFLADGEAVNGLLTGKID